MNNHGLRTPGEEIAFTARPKIKSQSQIFSYSQSIFCLPHQPKISDFFDLSLHLVSVVRGPDVKGLNDIPKSGGPGPFGPPAPTALDSLGSHFAAFTSMKNPCDINYQQSYSTAQCSTVRRRRGARSAPRQHARGGRGSFSAKLTAAGSLFQLKCRPVLW